MPSVPRDGAWSQPWGPLPGGWQEVMATLSGKVLVAGGWEQGSLLATRSGTLCHLLTARAMPQTQGFLGGSRLSLSWVGWLPPWPGRRVGNNETDRSLTRHPEIPACSGAHWVHTIYLALNHTRCPSLRCSGHLVQSSADRLVILFHGLGDHPGSQPAASVLGHPLSI